MTNDNKNKPGFDSWEKWLLMSVIILALSGVVIFMNVRVYGWIDGAVYIAVVAFIVLLSFLITRHIRRNPVTTNFLRAAFIFEVLLCIALGVNVIFSLSTMREMSVYRQSEQNRTAAIEAVGKLRGSRNQRDALKYARGNEKTDQVRTSEQVFAENERGLFYILCSEIGIALLATFVLLGLSVFDKNLDGIPDVFQQSQAMIPREPAYVVDDSEDWKPRIARLQDRGKYSSH